MQLQHNPCYWDIRMPVSMWLIALPKTFCHITWLKISFSIRKSVGLLPKLNFPLLYLLSKAAWPISIDEGSQTRNLFYHSSTEFRNGITQYIPFIGDFVGFVVSWCPLAYIHHSYCLFSMVGLRLHALYIFM